MRLPGRRNDGVETFDFLIELRCPRRHAIGSVVEEGDLPDRRHVYQMAWQDTPAGGKLTRRCPKCGADAQVAWSRILGELADMRRSDRPRLEIVVGC